MEVEEEEDDEEVEEAEAAVWHPSSLVDFCRQNKEIFSWMTFGLLARRGVAAAVMTRYAAPM